MKNIRIMTLFFSIQILVKSAIAHFFIFFKIGHESVIFFEIYNISKKILEL